MNDRGQYGGRWGSRYGYAGPRTMIGQSPESLKKELERLNGEVRSFQIAISAQREEIAMQAPEQIHQTPIGVFFQKKWAPFYRSWRHYYDEVKDTGGLGWRVGAKALEKSLSDWQSKLIDLRADAPLKTNGSRSLEAPAPTTSPSPALSPTAAPERPVDQAPPSDKEKSANVGLYVALGLGAIAVAAAVMAFRTEAA